VAEFGVDTHVLRGAAVQVELLAIGVDAAAAAVPARLLAVAEQLGGARCGPVVQHLATTVTSALAGLSTALVGLRHGLATAAEAYDTAEALATARSEQVR
jgi:hypothetical protein